jgi:Uma2 family endonuclease
VTVPCAVTPGFDAYEGASAYDQVVCLHDVTWADYERLLEIRGERSVPRYTYLQGELEIMSPSNTHERIKSTIGCLVEVWCLEKSIEFTTVGSWTIKDEALARGVEPDECYVFGEGAEASRPHLAIEVEWTRGLIDKRRVYEKLGVAELWVWSRGRIRIHELRDGSYAPVEQSQFVPGIDLRLMERCVQLPTTSAAIREYRAGIR